VSPDDFPRIALGVDGASEPAHLGHPDFRANRKASATLHPEFEVEASDPTSFVATNLNNALKL
jgi:hypothetical protein